MKFEEPDAMTQEEINDLLDGLDEAFGPPPEAAPTQDRETFEAWASLYRALRVRDHLLAEDDDACHWVTIRGNPICIGGPKHGAHYEKAAKHPRPEDQFQTPVGPEPQRRPLTPDTYEDPFEDVLGPGDIDKEHLPVLIREVIKRIYAALYRKGIHAAERIPLDHGGYALVDRYGEIVEGPLPLIGTILAEPTHEGDCHWVTIRGNAVCIGGQTHGSHEKGEEPTKDDVLGSVKGVRVSTVEEAYNLLTKQQKVILAKPEMVSTLLDKVSEEYHKAKASGLKQAKINLCNVAVEGTNMFCEGNKGISRVHMPQLRGIPLPGSKADQTMPKSKTGKVNAGPAFRDHLVAMGVKVVDEDFPARLLKASQTELDGTQVADIMKVLESGKLPPKEDRIFISRDNYVIDGHHRWAAKIAKDYRTINDIDMTFPIERIDLPILDVLVEAHKFTKALGIPTQEFGDRSDRTP